MNSDKQLTNIFDIQLADFLMYLGEGVEKHGRSRFHLTQHDSLVIQGNTFFWNQRNLLGKKIYDLCRELYGWDTKKTFREANIFMEKVNNKEIEPMKVDINKREYKTYEKKEELPLELKMTKYKKDIAINYLVGKRKIPDYIVETLIRSEHILVDDKENICFVIKDRNKKIFGFEKVGTYDSSKFRCNESEAKGFNLQFDDNYESIYVFESPIDLLSFGYLNKENTKEKSILLSVAGVRIDILDSYITKNTKEIIVCTDNDEAGNNFYKSVKEKYYNLNISRELPITKDWNEDLQKGFSKKIKGAKMSVNLKNDELKEKILSIMSEKIETNEKNNTIMTVRQLNQYIPNSDKENIKKALIELKEESKLYNVTEYMAVINFNNELSEYKRNIYFTDKKEWASYLNESKHKTPVDISNSYLTKLDENGNFVDSKTGEIKEPSNLSKNAIKVYQTYQKLIEEKENKVAIDSNELQKESGFSYSQWNDFKEATKELGKAKVLYGAENRSYDDLKWVYTDNKKVYSELKQTQERYAKVVNKDKTKEVEEKISNDINLDNEIDENIETGEIE